MKFVRFRSFALLLSCAAAAGCAEPGRQPSAGAAGAVPVAAVSAYAETEPVASAGDAADDPAIWVDPADPSRSLVIGTDKQRGLHLYDLWGRELQALPDGRLNNVDLRGGFVLAGREVVLVAASNRSDNTIRFYLLDPVARRLQAAGAGLPTGLREPYGICLYASRQGGHYVFVNDAGTGRMRQWQLDGSGAQIAGRLVREFVVGSQAEGCAADDEQGALYVAEEDVGLWKYGAEPDAGFGRRLIDRVGGASGLVADLEGVAIWRGREGRGYLVVSNQGANDYAIYRREGAHQFVGRFAVRPDAAAAIDGTADTDGIEVVSAALGPELPAGLLVVQDGSNEPMPGRQNFKLVSWFEVARALGLDAGR